MTDLTPTDRLEMIGNSLDYLHTTVANQTEASGLADILEIIRVFATDCPINNNGGKNDRTRN